MSQDPVHPEKSNRKWWVAGCMGVFFMLVCLSCGLLSFQISQSNNKLDQGMAALGNGDCTTAVVHFDEVIGSTWSTEEYKEQALENKTLCQKYMALIQSQESGDVGSALVGYDDLIRENSGSPLVTTIEQQAKTTFASAPHQLANTAVCQRLDSYVERNWLVDSATNLPLFYQACGQIFTEAGDYNQAVTLYERFVVAYPDHPDFEAVERSLAKAAVAQARQAGAGTIAPPQSVGGSGTGPAIVIIQNDSPEQISLVFSGPEAHFELIEICSDCEDFTVSPSFCPEKGPVGRYELPAGTYDVVVKSISDEGITPFTGTWELISGEEYYSCFFLVNR